MFDIDYLQRPLWLLVRSQPVLACCSSLVYHQGTTARLAVCIAQVGLAVMTVLQFLHCAL